MGIMTETGWKTGPGNRWQTGLRNGNGWQMGPGNGTGYRTGNRTRMENERELGEVQASESGTTCKNGQMKRPNETRMREPLLKQPQPQLEPQIG